MITLVSLSSSLLNSKQATYCVAVKRRSGYSDTLR